MSPLNVWAMGIKRNSKFYVVGGPVQPDRDCYVERNADSELTRRMLDGDYCHVFAQRHSGKTSLAAHTAWQLRDQGVKVAYVELTQERRDDSK